MPNDENPNNDFFEDDPSKETQNDGTSSGATEGGEGSQDQNESSTAEGEGSEQGEEKKEPAQPTLTVDEIAEAMKKAGLGAQPTPAKQQPPASQEDFDKAFNVFRPNSDIIKAIRSDDEDIALGAIDMLIEGINKQSTTMAAYLVQQANERMNQQYAPVKQYVDSQTETNLYGEFYKKNEDLKPYDSLVRAVVDQLKQSGFQADTKEAGFKHLAGQVRGMMKNLPGLSEKANAPTQSGKIPTLQSGGQGGAGARQTGQHKSKSAGQAVFD